MSLLPWQTAVIESAELRCTLLPDKGGELRSILHRASGVELLATLRDVPLDDGSHTLISPGADEPAFNRWYAGGWQELLPNGDAPCSVDGISHSFHGEAWGRPWRIVNRTAASITTEVDLQWPPLRLQRTIILTNQPTAVEITERLTNTGSAPARILWGHHPAFGAPLVAEGATIIAPAARLETVHCDATSRLQPARDLVWPFAHTTSGEPIDVSVVGDAARGTHDLCLLHGYTVGRVGIDSPALGLRATLEFDPALFPWLWIWQLYGGAEAAPFAGACCLALEPWSGPPTLTRAIAEDSALTIDPGASRTTTLRLLIEPSRPTTTQPDDNHGAHHHHEHSIR